MDFSSYQKTWESLARFDPMWAILTTDEKKGRKWSADEFFENGRTEIGSLMHHLHSLGISTGSGRALDFGCGVGRLSQALSEHFESVTGVDISSEMISQANAFNRFAGRCRYVVNSTPDLRGFAENTFGFVYSNMVLQHIPPKVSKRYIQEFLRVLEPNGIVVFQMPGFIPWRRRIQWRRRVFRVLQALGFNEKFTIQTLGLTPMRMSYLPLKTVEILLVACNARLLETISWTGLDILSHRYIAQKVVPKPNTPASS